MRNPALHLVGIAASPGGGALFSLTKAEEELRNWLESRLDALGIDPVAYSRFVLSLLRCPDSVLSPPLVPQSFENRSRVTSASAGCRRRGARRYKQELPQHDDLDQRYVVVQCLTKAADQKLGVESLVDELCAKLKELEGSKHENENEQLKTATNIEVQVPLEDLTPHDRALRYYAAFPALQPVAHLKMPYCKETNSSSNFVNDTNNNNRSNRNNNNKKNKGIFNTNKSDSLLFHQKAKFTDVLVEHKDISEKTDFDFIKSVDECQVEKDYQEEELDQIKLDQLKAKFDQSLEALWDSGTGNPQGIDSIWAAPSLSIPSGPSHWPTDSTQAAYSMITEKNSRKEFDSPVYKDNLRIDDSPLIPRDIDLLNMEECSDESEIKNTIGCKFNWPELNNIDRCAWNWKDNDKMKWKSSAENRSSFFPVKESCLQQKCTNSSEPDEDLLTSARTHFRPIKEDGQYKDGTTFRVNNTLDKVNYRRSDSGNLFYLSDDESPYMEYRQPTLKEPSNLVLKFRVCQCDKSVQTEPIILSPLKRRIISEKNHFYFSSNRTQDVIAADSEDFISRNERKRRYSSSFNYQPLTVLRPLTL